MSAFNNCYTGSDPIGFNFTKPTIVCEKCFHPDKTQCFCGTLDKSFEPLRNLKDRYAPKIDLGSIVNVEPYGNGLVISYVAGSKPTNWEVRLDNVSPYSRQIRRRGIRRQKRKSESSWCRFRRKTSTNITYLNSKTK